MQEKPHIPIKNIYYMLCYAWDILPRGNDRLTGVESFDNIYNLLAKIMINEVNLIIKRGFHREYIQYEEELSLIKGKIDVANSIRQQSLIRKRLICHFDEFSDNVPFNQILKSTMSVLIKAPYLNHEFKKQLISIRYYFANIHEKKMTKQMFSNLKYSRNNMHYKMLMHICELIYLGLLSNEKDNKVKFVEFLRNEQMSHLYEKFVLNFYKKHLPSNIYKTYSPKIDWNLDVDFSHVGLEYLPQMKTDIVIENLNKKTQLIIDTKYYTSALKSSHRSEVKKLISGNLYQISTYVTNSSYPGEKMGMLLYPTTERELDLEFKMNHKMIKIKTLNLDSDWQSIEKRLLNIAYQN